MFWVIFHAIFLTLFLIDNQIKITSFLQAVLRSLCWIVLAFLWNGVIYLKMGSDLALQFFTAYCVEQALSMDNLYLFTSIFSAFKLSSVHQRWILSWGILGAAVFRLSLIVLGIKAISWFHPLIYVMGALTFYAGIKLVFSASSELDYQKGIHFLKKHFPVTESVIGNKLYIIEGGVFKWTLLAVALLMVEGIDLIFALDSVPVVFGMTSNLLVAYTSNVCAILGLRSLYFILIPYLGQVEKFQKVLGSMLLLIGGKMILSGIYEIPSFIFLFLTLAILITAFCKARISFSSQG
ncbi:MAG: hypothetical protein QRY72_02525 [Candidatus Rhabdochlamydia sp.]